MSSPTGTCHICRGSGTLVCMQAGTLEFWTCPACGGDGVRALFAPPWVNRRRYTTPEPKP